MKSLKSSSIFTANNSVLLIIVVFIFIAVGMFFLIQKMNPWYCKIILIINCRFIPKIFYLDIFIYF